MRLFKRRPNLADVFSAAVFIVPRHREDTYRWVGVGVRSDWDKWLREHKTYRLPTHRVRFVRIEIQEGTMFKSCELTINDWNDGKRWKG